MNQFEYGAALPTSKPRARRPVRINFPAMCLCIFVPWILFCLMFAVMSFSIHYTEKALCYLFVMVGLIFVVVVAKLALDAVKNQQLDPYNSSTWSVHLAVACFMAWILGVALGDMNFFYNMEPFYDASNLNNYPFVDPSRMPGQQVMDAGQMTFVPGSKLDLKKSMTFHNLDTYCVTPIVNSNSKTPAASYDFWAVGMNCCSGGPGDFSCGEYNNPHVSSGLRVMREDQREFFRLAVKQAESAYNIKAQHPLFFHWMQDPAAELVAYMDEGFKYYTLGVFAFFAFTFFFVIVSVVFFSWA